MNFQVICVKSAMNAHCPYQVVEQTTGQGVGWIDRFLDREYVRRVANKSLRIYAYNLLHFVRWWDTIHHTVDITEVDLTESTLLDYLRFPSGLEPPVAASTINTCIAHADRAIRNEFPDAPCQIARGFHQYFLQRKPMGLESAHGHEQAACQENPGSTSCLSRSMKWHASGEAFTTRAARPSSA
jgi:hypothetical protein